MDQAVGVGGDVVDAEFEVDVKQPQPSTVEQRNEIKALLKTLDADSTSIDAMLAKRNVQAITQLTWLQADQLIFALRERLAGESRLSESASSSDVTGPVDQATVDEIKQLLAGNPNLIGKIKDHLVAHGKTKIADLSMSDAELLKNCLQMKSMESFFAKSLDADGGRAPS
jgi:hypothetical protein